MIAAVGVDQLNNNLANSSNDKSDNAIPVGIVQSIAHTLQFIKIALATPSDYLNGGS